MEEIKLKLDDAPLIISTAYPASSVAISWTKQTDFVSTVDASKSTRNLFEEKLRWILRQYHALQKQDDLRSIAPHVIPYAAKVNMEVTASKSQLTRSIPKLLQIPNQYAQQLSRSLSESLKILSVQGGIETDGVPAGIVQDRKRIRLIEVHPLNEFELMTPLAYELSSVSWSSTLEALDTKRYIEKQKLLKNLLSSRPLPASLRYRFELVIEPQIFRELHSKFSFQEVYAQLPTPGHGYSVPKVNDGGMIERCFDLSYELYSELQSAAPQLAPLACLYGHRQRYLVEIDGPHVGLLFDKNIKLTQPAINIAKLIRKEISQRHQTIGSWFSDKEKKNK